MHHHAAIIVVLLSAAFVACRPMRAGEPCPVDPGLIASLEQGVGLEEIEPEKGGGYQVDTPFGFPTDEHLALLAEVPNVRVFYCRDEFSPAAWRHVGKLSSLEVLMAEGPNIVDEDLLCLGDLPQLQQLIVRSYGRSRKRFGDAALPPIRAMKRLERLALESDAMTDKGLKHLADLHSLQVLELRGGFGDEGVAALANLHQLRRLVLRGKFTDKALSSLRELEKLESLTLISPSLRGERLGELAHLPHLRSLKFCGGEHATLAGLRRWPALRVLNLASPSTGDALLASLGETPRLTSLSLESSSVSDEGLAALKNFPVLEELDLQNTAVTDAGMKHLTSLKQLHSLRIGNVERETLIGGSGLADVASLPSLSVLDISYIDLRDCRLAMLAGAGRPQSLVFNRKDATVTLDWKRLQQLRPRLSSRAESVITEATALDFPVRIAR
ncbi:MAG: hypothetical protein RIC55_14250 [Pirellulaceae bacterium]